MFYTHTHTLACNLQKYQENKSQGKTKELFNSKEAWPLNAAHDYTMDPVVIKDIIGTICDIWMNSVDWMVVAY